MSDSVLPFTGERFTPECVREISYEHWHRYAFAQSLSAGRRVLDADIDEFFDSVDHELLLRFLQRDLHDHSLLPLIRRWLVKRPRYHLHFTPTGSSWLNLVARCLAELTNKQMRRGVHKSVQALEKDIRTWIAAAFPAPGQEDEAFRAAGPGDRFEGHVEEVAILRSSSRSLPVREPSTGPSSRGRPRTSLPAGRPTPSARPSSRPRTAAERPRRRASRPGFRKTSSAAGSAPAPAYRARSRST